MDILRTSEGRFENLPGYFFKPHYININGFRIHHVEEGPKKSEKILLMHGEPTWAYLYRHMIPILADKGFHIIAPDLIGFGRSDKPKNQTDHSYRKHVEWITKWLKAIDLKDITMFCQDWGSLIGLRVAIENKERFKRIILANGGLPTGEQRMNDAFLKWREFSRSSPQFKIERIIQGGTVTKLSKDALRGYAAPFPDESYMAGARILPSLVPISRADPEHKANRRAIEEYKKWDIPFLTTFSDKDPITRGGEKFWQENVLGARGQNHIIIKNAGHFLQEDKGPELAEVIIKFIENNP
ncbi:MAG: haloalkane dehalogenase [Promethearchaeota archaeon]